MLPDEYGVKIVFTFIQLHSESSPSLGDERMIPSLRHKNVYSSELFSDMSSVALISERLRVATITPITESERVTGEAKTKTVSPLILP